MRTNNRAFAAGAAVLITIAVGAVSAKPKAGEQAESVTGRAGAAAVSSEGARQPRLTADMVRNAHDAGTPLQESAPAGAGLSAQQEQAGGRGSLAQQPNPGSPASGSGAAGQASLSAASRRWQQEHPDHLPGNWPGRWSGWPGLKQQPTGRHTYPWSPPPAAAAPSTTAPTAVGTATHTAQPPDGAPPSATSPSGGAPAAGLHPPIVVKSSLPTQSSSTTPISSPISTPVGSTPISTPVRTTTTANSTSPAAPGLPTATGVIPRRSGLPWVSGVYVPSGSPAEVEKFAAWRGSPVDVVVAWSARQTWSDIVNPSWLYDDWKNTPYRMAFGVAPVPEGDSSATMAGCAAGDYTDEWTQFGQHIVAAGLGDSVIRLGWEFNGNWYKWQAGNPAQFAECYRRIVTTVRKVAPGLLWDWTVNRGPGQSVTDPRQAYPGDAYVDMVGVDSYDMWPGASDEATWQQQYAGDFGLKFWADFAKQHGKKISVPEWGVYPTAGQNGGDNAFYIAKMEAFFAAQGSNLGYESYFNENAGYYGGAIFAPTQNPAAAAKYKAALAAVSRPS